jgi:hypothetical protein
MLQGLGLKVKNGINNLALKPMDASLVSNPYQEGWFGGFAWKWYADPNTKTKGIVLITLHKKKTCFGRIKKKWYNNL